MVYRRQWVAAVRKSDRTAISSSSNQPTDERATWAHWLQQSHRVMGTGPERPQAGWPERVELWRRRVVK